MATQLNSAKRGIATEEMKKVAKDEDLDINFVIKGIANGSIIIPKNVLRKQQIKPTGIGRGLKTKVNVNIGNIHFVSKPRRGNFKGQSCGEIWGRYNNGPIGWWRFESNKR